MKTLYAVMYFVAVGNTCTVDGDCTIMDPGTVCSGGSCICNPTLFPDPAIGDAGDCVDNFLPNTCIF